MRRQSLAWAVEILSLDCLRKTEISKFQIYSRRSNSDLTAQPYFLISGRLGLIFRAEGWVCAAEPLAK